MQKIIKSGIEDYLVGCLRKHLAGDIPFFGTPGRENMGLRETSYGKEKAMNYKSHQKGWRWECEVSETCIWLLSYGFCKAL